MRWMLLVMLVIIAGCKVATLETTVVRPIATDKSKVGKVITVGVFIDNRFPFWPRNETSSPLVKESEKQSKDFEPQTSLKEIRIPMGEVRSQLAGTMRISQRFEEIINPPTTLTGKTLPQMLKKALETSDYLLVGEINNFYVQDLGRNIRGFFSYPLDLLFGVPNIPAAILTGQKALIFTGGFVAAHTAGCYLSLSLTLYSVESGNPLTTFHIEEIATRPVTSIDIFGEFNILEDDWVDLGRSLGRVALANAMNEVVDQVAQAIQKNSAQKTGDEQ